ncbi:hypothetical protein HDU67_007999 [Dinochytrium kinnereticum]|nr:hypothetical protein HDU67_007999 [Dinochytrium kinnereticum]
MPAQQIDEVLWRKVIDVHAHIIDSPDTLPMLESLRIAGVCIMGTRVDDWAVLRDLAMRSSKAIIAFGLCLVTLEATEGKNPTWLEQLESLLIEKADAFVGEIGLDGVATYPNSNVKYDMDHQLVIFRTQFELAAKLQRCVSVHAVQCFGKILQFFSERVKAFPKKKKEVNANRDEGVDMYMAKWPAAIMLHSFSGSLDILKAILRFPKPIADRFYFSFSYVVNARSMQKTEEKIRMIPDDRILIESDLHDSELIEDACIQACEMVASAKGWSMPETIGRTGANAKAFLSQQQHK